MNDFVWIVAIVLGVGALARSRQLTEYVVREQSATFGFRVHGAEMRIARAVVLLIGAVAVGAGVLGLLGYVPSNRS